MFCHLCVHHHLGSSHLTPSVRRQARQLAALVADLSQEATQQGLGEGRIVAQQRRVFVPRIFNGFSPSMEHQNGSRLDVFVNSGVKQMVRLVMAVLFIYILNIVKQRFPDSERIPVATATIKSGFPLAQLQCCRASSPEPAVDRHLHPQDVPMAGGCLFPQRGKNW